MADDRDDSQRTEEPTQRRLDDAREKGQAATSREVNHWFMMLAATLVAAMLAPATAAGIKQALLPFVEQPDAIATDPEHLRSVFVGLFRAVALACLLPAAALMAAAIGGSLVQHGVLFSLEQIAPKLERISPKGGARRLFSGQALLEFVKGIAKLAIVGATIAIVLWPSLRTVGNLPMMELNAVLDLGHDLATRLLVTVVSVMTIIGAVDLLYQRFAHMRRLRMSRQELKEEFKHSEGDPVIKSRLRQIRMERARRRMMAAVPKADVVVVNPTHFAVALKYDPGAMAAPKVTAKGADRMAQRIREVAEESKVPIVENPPLARGLYAAVEIDQEIPPEHYKAVAQIIGYIMKLKGRATPKASGRR